MKYASSRASEASLLKYEKFIKEHYEQPRNGKLIDAIQRIPKPLDVEKDDGDENKDEELEKEMIGECSRNILC